MKRIMLNIENSSVNWQHVSLWSPIEEDTAIVGDCFYASIIFMSQAIMGGMKNLTLKTGIFDFNGEDIYHCWIKHSTLGQKFVINVSNLLLPGQNIKIFPQKFYKEQNKVKRIIQRIPDKDFKASAIKFGTIKQEDNEYTVELDVSKFTKHLLAPTLTELDNYISTPKL